MAGLGHPIIFQRVSRLGSVTARQSSSGRQQNFAALNIGHHLCSAGRPSRWAFGPHSSSCNILNIICHVLYETLHVLAVGKFLGFHYTDDSAMTLAIANSLIRQPAVAVDVHQFDAKDMANG